MWSVKGRTDKLLSGPSSDVLQANMFKKKGGEIRKKEWWNNMKVKAVVIGILIVLALVIWLSICHGFVCH